jgi:aryl-alcohol dehydrogenase-like predicted oxidoreductase
VEYSLFAREPEDELLPTCRELGVGLVAYSPLGRGILTGAISDVADLADDDYRRVDPRYAAANLAANLRLVAALSEGAQRRGCTAGQLALAWLLATGPDVVPIPGTKRQAHLAENLGAAAIALSPQEWAELGRAVPATAVAGDRYPPAELSRLGI